jgi:hypothetical protein
MRVFRLRILGLAGVFAAIAALATPSPANAGFSILLHETGYADQMFTPALVSGQYTLPTTVFGDYSIQVGGRDSAPGINVFQGGALVTQNTLTVNNISGGTPLSSLVITVQDNTFSNNLGNPGNLINTLSTTEIDVGLVTASSFVNTPSNNTPVVLASHTLFGGGTSNAIVPMGSGSTFTLGSVATISGLVGAGATDNFTVTSLVVSPEPTSMLAVITGLPVLGFAVWYRRRSTLKVA